MHKYVKFMHIVKNVKFYDFVSLYFFMLARSFINMTGSTEEFFLFSQLNTLEASLSVYHMIWQV